MEDIFEKRAKVLVTKALQQPSINESSLLENLLRGFQRSSVATPFVASEQIESPTFGGRLAESVGEVVGDIPAMAVGGSLGSLGGAALGGLLGPIGSGIGALIGGGAGAFATPTAVKSIAQESRKGTPITDAFGNVLYETGKSGLIGAATGIGGKIAQPLLKGLGGKVGEKILSKAVGRGATTTAGELAGMAAGQKFTGQAPSAEEALQNALLLGGMKVAGGIAKKLPIKKVSEPINLDKMLTKSPERTKYFSILKDHVGERNAKIVESSFKWRDVLEHAEKKGKFTPEQLEDMTYYRQRTENPTKKGDSFDALAKRLPEHAKEFVDNVIDTHLKETLKTYNDNPATKDINPREGLEQIYLPGLYKGDAIEIKQAINRVGSKLKIKNPFSNEKTFLNYADAFKEVGLKPRFSNIIDLMKHYDNVMIKATANAEFASKIKDLESSNKRLIVRATDGKAYDDAQANGYVPFIDPFLRKNTGKPALVDPELAPALQGVFNEYSYRPDSKVLKYYDAVSDKLRYLHTNFSPFHYIALTEHNVPALKSLNIPAWMRQGRALRNNKEFMKDAARSGLTLGHGDTSGTYLFKEFQPNIKAKTFDSWTQSFINKEIKAGTPPDAARIKEIKRDMATFVNNLYGGQQWETMQFFNKPENLKLVRRLIGFPDWSVSALRNAQSIFKGGPLGSATRKTWLNYALFYFGTRSLFDAFFKGFIQTDPDKKLLGIRFDPKKMIDYLSLTGKGPEQWWQFPLPDVPVKIAGIEFNPGRDVEGKRLYGHLGKSALEIGHYFTKTGSELFSKSNPVLQALYKQIVSSTPSEYGPFMIQSAYKYGKQVPWGGTEPGTYDRFVARSKQLASEFMPYSVRGILPKSLTGEYETGIGKYVGSFGGSFPVSKGFTPFKAIPYFEKALKARDTKKINELKSVLLDNGYSYKEINKKISLVRNDLIKKGKLSKKDLP